jgi:hypothetical protein
MSDKQHCPAGVTILDADGQPYETLPSGVTVTFTPADPSVADFTVGPDGMNGDITSGKVGSTSIASKVTFADGTVFDDALSVSVTNSKPGSANFTAGTPVDE